MQFAKASTESRWVVQIDLAVSCNSLLSCNTEISKCFPGCPVIDKGLIEPNEWTVFNEDGQYGW